MVPLNSSPSVAAQVFAGVRALCISLPLTRGQIDRRLVPQGGAYALSSLAPPIVHPTTHPVLWKPHSLTPAFLHSRSIKCCRLVNGRPKYCLQNDVSSRSLRTLRGASLLRGGRTSPSPGAGGASAGEEPIGDGQRDALPLGVHPQDDEIAGTGLGRDVRPSMTSPLVWPGMSRRLRRIVSVMESVLLGDSGKPSREGPSARPAPGGEPVEPGDEAVRVVHFAKRQEPAEA